MVTKKLPTEVPVSEKTTPLHQLHRDLGAKMVSFANYGMPLFYPTGILKEHLHTRKSACLFDVSHMGQILVSGPGAVPYLERLLPADIENMSRGQSCYSFFLNQEACFIDDLIVSRLDQDQFLLVLNAACKNSDSEHMHRHAPGFDIQIDVRQAGLIALQGPEAASVLGDLGYQVDDLAFMTCKAFGALLAGRSGYTGEDGFEIALPCEETEPFARKILEDPRVEAAGLGARDTLRMEAGLPLYGQDLTREINPLQAGMLWAIRKPRPEGTSFIGEQKLKNLKEGNLPMRKRIGFIPEGRAPARAGTKLYTESGEEIGMITSGGFAPSLGHPVSHAYVEQNQAVKGNRLLAEVRGKSLPGLLCGMPFIKPSYKRGKHNKTG